MTKAHNNISNFDTTVIFTKKCKCGLGGAVQGARCKARRDKVRNGAKDQLWLMRETRFASKPQRSPEVQNHSDRASPALIRLLEQSEHQSSIIRSWQNNCYISQGFVSQFPSVSQVTSSQVIPTSNCK